LLRYRERAEVKRKDERFARLDVSDVFAVEHVAELVEDLFVDSVLLVVGIVDVGGSASERKRGLLSSGFGGRASGEGD
jgi:hypothetical protein